MTRDDKRTKSFSLKNENAYKVEKLAFDKKIRESEVVDDMIEVYDGS